MSARLKTLLLAGSLALSVGSASADTPSRVRGTVVALDGATLTVKSRSGETVAIKLADNWAASSVIKASMADIKPGVFVGVASAPKEGDVDDLEALELVVFPEAMRGSNEGHYAWDLQPKSMMTNANVTSKVEGVKGQVLTLSYKGGDRKVTLPSDTPIVTFASATQADIKPGAAVFVPAQKKDDGSLQAGRVLVGKDGVVPPM